MNKMIAMVGLCLSALFLMTDESSGSIPPKDITNSDDDSEDETKTPRGVRNNNPGNIKKTGDNWDGSNGNDGTFVIFLEPEYGIRAMIKLFRKYTDDYNLNSIAEIIGRYAPQNENDTMEYVNYVSGFMNIDKDEWLDFPSDFYKLVEAVIYFENGEQPYQPQTIISALHLAGEYS